MPEQAVREFCRAHAPRSGQPARRLTGNRPCGRRQPVVTGGAVWHRSGRLEIDERQHRKRSPAGGSPGGRNPRRGVKRWGVVRFVLLGLIAVVLAFPASAGADGSRLPPVAVAATDLADATGAVAPSAAARHVVFSRQVPGTGRFELVEWSAGRGLRVLPVGDRAVPFDADVGRDAAGRAVVSYSAESRENLCVASRQSAWDLPLLLPWADLAVDLPAVEHRR